MSDPDTLTIAGTGAISAIADKSGNGWTLSQGTDAQRPIVGYVGNEMAAYYDGSNKSLSTLNTLNVSQPCTVVSLAKVGPVQAGAAAVWTNPAVSNAGALLFTKRQDISNKAAVYGGNTVAVSAAALSLNTEYLAVTQLNGAAGSHGFNGAAPTTYNFGTVGIGSGFRWGGDSAGGSGFNGHICFSIIINRVLTDSERQSLEGYVASRFRLNQIVLPPGHPSYNTPLNPVQRIIVFGDSLSLTGGSCTTLLQFALGFNGLNYSEGGQGITWIADSAVSHAGEITANDIVIINGGYNNNPWNTAGFVEGEMARGVASFPVGTRYLVWGIPTADVAAYYTGGADRGKLNTINANLAATYGTRFVNVDAILKAASTHTGQDAVDDANGIVPASQRMDAVHWNAAGHLTLKTALRAQVQSLGWG